MRVGTSTPRADPSRDYAFQMFERIESSDAAGAGSAAALKAKALQLTGGPNSPPLHSGRNVYGKLVDEGAADVVITYCTNATEAKRQAPALQVLPVPEAINVSALYGIATLKPVSPAAQAFVDFVTGEQAQKTLAERGSARPDSVIAAARTRCAMRRSRRSRVRCAPYPHPPELRLLVSNPRAQRGPYPAGLRAILNLARANENRSWLAGWSGLNAGPTPLVALPGLARQFGVAALHLKDEALRSPLGSFKALGAPIALIRLLLQRPGFETIDPTGLLQGHYAHAVRDFTVISATDGNHGRALAAAARSVGCPCVIVLHAHVSAEREAAIAELGARIVRVAGNYDDSVIEAERLARAQDWHVVSDTSYPGYEAIPRDVMQGYGIIVAELQEQISAPPGACPFTHVLLQGGVGGLAAGVAGSLWEIYAGRRPDFIVVEPVQADCLLQSALQGRAARASGSVDSVMAGLACGETSPLAWQFLEPVVDQFMTIEDDAAVAAMRLLANSAAGDAPVVAGESGAAGIAGLQSLCADPAAAAQCGLSARSRVLVINTEGATAPSIYQQLVGRSAEEVRNAD